METPGAGWMTVGGVRLEYAWHGPAPADAPTIVFLHEGLGSVSTWRGFPARLAEACGCGALVYARSGYGRSDPAPPPRPVGFMHDEAEVLDAVLREGGVREAILFGHSDGASIALIHAARFPDSCVRAVVVEAPHVFVEECTVASIALLPERYRATEMRAKLARHHADVDATFGGWTEVWLRPEFRAWSIADLLPAMRLPVLVIQGDADEYGTTAQVDAIRASSSGPVEVVALPGRGHAPHAEQPDAVLAAAAEFIGRTAIAPD
ncbi:alpha/beta fold hydrolase [Longimicrobium terrae]|uniref:Pimeloyl-ACP methyl ester carboxylesterase n=1 Tax=Longimicrobium terrae TaxID=1639882 RepID=A0A841H7B4_9BACT|nr:alpha/beta hydrolase [Longimicrobium terrae]MBB4638238.1 pimeloyl-ACP methyl ester carboxylesterase [Longimicrobium terrae]MBB6073792.1 pimeloyl-ACP methyl ester carboxylesterase [Longimicrobium terrae]NNC30285.1 alpha/beta hydrolase [Longimicrobium terrae]